MAKVVIAIACSDTYAKYLSITLSSIAKTASSNRQYHVVIIERNIKPNNKEKMIWQLSSVKNFSVEFVGISAFLRRSISHHDNLRISEETYYRILIPWILSAYDRVIAIDCDMVFDDDIANLFDMDIGNNLVGAVRDIVAEGEAADFKLGKWIYVERILKLERPYHIFNGGLTLLDLKRIRDSIRLESIIELLRNYDFVTFDQDVFNRLYNRRCYEIDMAWNYIVLSSRQLVQCYNSAPENIRRLYDKSATDIKVFHFLGAVKPWDDCQVPHSNQFWKYVSGSPFEEEIRRASLSQSKDKDCNAKVAGGIFTWLFPTRSWRRLLVKFLLPCRGSPMERKFRRLLKWTCNQTP